jgi:hypothetical protein
MINVIMFNFAATSYHDYLISALVLVSLQVHGSCVGHVVFADCTELKFTSSGFPPAA